VVAIERRETQFSFLISVGFGTQSTWSKFSTTSPRDLCFNQLQFPLSLLHVRLECTRVCAFLCSHAANKAKPPTAAVDSPSLCELQRSFPDMAHANGRSLCEPCFQPMLRCFSFASVLGRRLAYVYSLLGCPGGK
jgi:hypothetical protein